MSGRFWEEKPLTELSREEWESLCDGCARCCLIKLEDEDDGTIYTTSLVCRYLDIDSGACGCYAERTQVVPDCLQITPENAGELSWMPQSCAYRLLAEGRPLPEWHPLLTGDRKAMQEAGITVSAFAICEDEVPEVEERVAYIID